VTDRHVYRSRDYGEEYLGQSWERLTDRLPHLRSPKFVIAHGAPGRLYAISDSRVFTRRLDETMWIRGSRFGIGEYADTYPWFVVDPYDPDHVWVGFKVRYGEFGPLSLFQESHDAGGTWSNTMESLWKLLSARGLTGVMSLGAPIQLNHLVADPRHPGTCYAALERGVARGLARSDGEEEQRSNAPPFVWRTSEQGFNIPLVRTLFVSHYSDWIFAGTPGGLFISKDGAETWEDGNLWLQFDKNTRRELGGAAFIDAYWRARYYGFIDDEMANQIGEN